MKREWYFVCAIDDAFEVQVLDSQGRARLAVRFQRGDRNVKVQDISIPPSVLGAAEATPQTGSQYVDRNGQLLDFYGNPISNPSA